MYRSNEATIWMSSSAMNPPKYITADVLPEKSAKRS
jgi:hypothetical protein